MHDAVDDDDERAGRSADLHAAAAERGDQKAGDDGGVETALGRDAGGDGKRQRQRKRNDPDHDSGDDVAPDCVARIPFSKTDDGLRDEQLTRIISCRMCVDRHCEDMAVTAKPWPQLSGIVKRTVVPLPGALLMSSVPPMLFARSRMVVRPKRGNSPRSLLPA